MLNRSRTCWCWHLFAGIALLAVLPSLSRAALEPDPSFTQPGLEDDLSAPSIIPLAAADGSVFVTNYAPYVNGSPAPSLLHFFADGSMDRRFESATHAAGGFFVYAYDDGRTLVYDGDGHIVRLLADGSPDPVFTRLAVSRFLTRISAVKGLNGRVILFGSGLATSGDSLIVLREDGTKDPAFSIPAGYTIYLHDVAVQSDGKILVSSVASPEKRYFPIARFGADGAFDPTFDASAALPSGNSGDSADVIVALPDGRVLAANYMKVIRLLSNGSIDPSYRPDYGGAPWPSGVSRANENGTLYFEQQGSENYEPVIYQRMLNADGTPDPRRIVTFESIHAASPVSRDDQVFYYASPVTQQRDSRRHVLSRATYRDGLDESFAVRFSQKAKSLKVQPQPDGKYLILGCFDYANAVALPDSFVNLIRINADGSLDRSFTPPPNVRDQGYLYDFDPLAVQSDGRILTEFQGNIRRLNPDGSLDATFPLLRGYTAQLDAMDRIYIGDPSLNLSRYTRDGILDPSFAPVATSGNFYVAPDGKTILRKLRQDGRGYELSRANIDGTPDLSYQSTKFDSTSTYLFSILSDGSIVACTEIYSMQEGVRPLRFLLIDSTGALVTTVDVPNNLRSAAEAFAGFVRDAGGGPAMIGVPNRGSSIRVAGDEVLLVPGQSESDDLRPMARLRGAKTVSSSESRKPAIFIQPRDQNTGLGKTIYFYVQNYGATPSTYQWFKDGVPVTDPRSTMGNVGTLTITGVKESDAGHYWVVITNSAGATTSNQATVELIPPPVAIRSPLTLTVSPSQLLAIPAGVVGDGVSYSWTVNGVPYISSYEVPGIGASTMMMPAIAGTYVCTATNKGGSVRTTATISVSETVDVGRLTNVSVRTRSGLDEQVLIVGFNITSTDESATMPLLIRASGLSLARFGVEDPMLNPSLTVRSKDSIIATNDDWAGATSIKTAADRVGAFPYLDDSRKDAAVFEPSFAAGTYTVQVDGVDRTTGTTLAEVYDATSSGAGRGAHLTNVSTRAMVNNEGALIVGFFISGSTGRTILLRAIGPALSQFDVPGILPSPQLTLKDDKGNTVAYNGGAAGDLVSRKAADLVGAFPLGIDANDAAMVVTLPPGSYTAHATGAGATGVALIEVYELP